MFSYHIYGHWHTVHIWWAWVWSPSLCKDISQDINLSRHRARHRVRGWPPPSSGLSPAFDCRPLLALGPKGSNVRSTLLCTSLYLPFNGNQTNNWYCMVLQGIEWYCKLHWYYSSDPEWLAYLPSKKNVSFVSPCMRLPCTLVLGLVKTFLIWYIVRKVADCSLQWKMWFWMKSRVEAMSKWDFSGWWSPSQSQCNARQCRWGEIALLVGRVGSCDDRSNCNYQRPPTTTLHTHELCHMSF